MPFRMSWSAEVDEKGIKPGVDAAQFDRAKGDMLVRVGDLSRNVWNAILQAGVLIADVSEPDNGAENNYAPTPS